MIPDLVGQSYTAQIEEALAAIRIISPGRYTWLGTRAPALPRRLERMLDAGELRKYLRLSIQQQLYKDFYIHGSVGPMVREATDDPEREAEFLGQLEDANEGAGFVDEGWSMLRMHQDRALVSRSDGLVLRVPLECVPGALLSDPSHTRVSVRFPKQYLKMSPGFYMATSNVPMARSHWTTVVRVYWNLSPVGAIAFLRDITRALNSRAIAFRLKVVNSPNRFLRCDTTILYISRADFPQVVPVLIRLHTSLTPHLRTGVPALTKPIASGVSVAEDPGRDESYGMHRCGLLADAALRAAASKTTGRRHLLELAFERFREDGLDVSRPYLQAGSEDQYAPIGVSLCSPARASAGTSRSATDRAASTYLELAAAIGMGLTHTAVWHDGRCNWIGAEPVDLRRKQRTSYRALGPDLYGGTAGVALFLGRLFAATGEREFKRTAVGAILHSAARATSIPQSARLGLHTGGTGIAWALTDLAVRLGESAFLRMAREVLELGCRSVDLPHQLDLLYGNAGAIPALLRLSTLWDDRTLVDHALRLGNELLAMARKTRRGWSWPSFDEPKQEHLTGLAHGCAGMIVALLELHATTGDMRFLEGAEQAWSYENSWYCPDERNWADLRDLRVNGRTQPRSFATYWCHGAAGIAMSRLRALEITDDPKYEKDALIALEATARMIDSALDTRTFNYSLCHGLAGNAEALAYGEDVLGNRSVRPDLVYAVAAAGIETYSRDGDWWPCGTHTGPTPSLLLGLAGIGHFYLRLGHPAIPGILLLREWGVDDA